MSTKSPDEIKKGLERLKFIANAGRIDDALALIQQLQAENVEKDARIQQLEAQNAELSGKFGQLQAERDAALENIRGDCVYCLHLCEDMVAPSCFDCANKGYYRWEWRGVQKEDGNDTN